MLRVRVCFLRVCVIELRRKVKILLEMLGELLEIVGLLNIIRWQWCWRRTSRKMKELDLNYIHVAMATLHVCELRRLCRCYTRESLDWIATADRWQLGNALLMWKPLTLGLI